MTLERRPSHALARIRHELAHLGERPEPASRRILPALADYLVSDHAGAYALSPVEHGNELEFYHFQGDGFPEWIPSFANALRRHPRGFLQFDPMRPEPAQRNRVCNLPVARVRAAVGTGPWASEPAAHHRMLLRFDQLRTLICDGPVLVAWVGVVRPQAYDPALERRLRRLIPLLRDRLVLDERLGIGAGAAAALAVAMERLSDAAYVMSPGGGVVHANAAGAAHLSAVPDLREELRRCTGRAEPGLTVHRLRAPGLPPYALAVRRTPPEPATARARALAAQLRLTPRQAQVLQGVARGASNKTIAVELGCAEISVERHVTALLARTGCPGRSALAARVWAER
ncbi:MAG TPA: helix-turn-helix transcriptional regulator [Anaeromyxobacter sp.]|nr:helix-turn-helix transcriptional regulator [Anaeromyxobacter sp.]